MRSASSAGETVTQRHVAQDPHISMPKRAETFNGASLKDSILNINANLLQTYLNKDGPEKSDSLAIRYIAANSDLSSDFGYHSRLCVDINHDIDGDNCACSLSDANHSLLKSGKKIAGEKDATLISKGQFEGILKTILNDYMRIKGENEQLRRDLEISDSSLAKIKSSLASKSTVQD